MIRNKMATKYKGILYMFLSALSSYGIMLYIAHFSGFNALMGSIMCVVLIGVYYIVWKGTIDQVASKADLVSNLLFAFLFSCALTLGYQLYRNDPELALKKAFFEALLLSAAIVPVVIQMTHCLCGIKNDKPNDASYAPLIISMVVISAAWISVWLALWPGVFGYDGTYWYSFMSRGYLHAKFSIPYQWLFYHFIDTGNRLFGSNEIGFSLFTFVQLLYILYAVWNIIKYIYQERGKKALVLCTVFYVIHLPISILAVSSAQDAAFMAAFGMCLLQLVKISKEPNVFWASKSNMIRFIISLLMLFIWRNNGIYSMVFTIIAAAIGFRYYGKKLISSLCIAILLFEIYSGPVLTMLGANKSSTLTEMMSVPSTQLAYVWNYSRDNLTEEERDELVEYISQDYLEKMNFISDNRISDNYKRNLNTELISANPIRFIKLYLQIGIKCPKAYLTAYLDLMFGMWNPDVQYYDRKMYHPYIETISNSQEYVKRQNPEYITTEHYSKFPALKKLIDKLFGAEVKYGQDDWKMEFNGLFLISTLYKFGIYFWATVYIVLLSITRRLKTMTLPLSLVLGLTLTILLGPVVLFRYIAPIVFSYPLLGAAFCETFNR